MFAEKSKGIVKLPPKNPIVILIRITLHLWMNIEKTYIVYNIKISNWKSYYILIYFMLFSFKV